MSGNTLQEFGKWRSRLWPIHTFELKKFIPMVLLLFLILFNYTVLRDTKDTLIVTAANSGAEAIPFLKFWGVLPCAVIFMLVYSKMSNKLSKPKLFYATVVPFLVFFGLFTTVLYPLKDYLHPTEFCDRLQTILPQGFMGMIAVIRNWTFSLFYVMAELWGSMVLSLCFWGFANDIIKVTESKRFYSLFMVFANVSLLIAGPSVILASKIRDSLPAGVDAWQVSLNYLMGMVLVSGVFVMLIYRWINKKVLTDTRFYDPAEQRSKKKEKPKMSMKESFLFLAKSRYIGCIALIVMGYGICINLVEVTWKGQLKLQYPNPNDYSAFMGLFSTIGGAITIMITFLFGGTAVRKFGWTKTALVTPIMLLCTGIFFLGFIIFKGSLGGVIALMGTTPLMLAVVFGMIQNILSKSSKYSFFDPTKEMAYIPLDQESKVKGKAAVDVVGARLGKSGGALIQQGFVLAFGSVAAIAFTSSVGVVLLGIIAVWIMASKALGKRFNDLTEQREAERAAEKAAAEEATTVEPAAEPAMAAVTSEEGAPTAS